MSHKDFLNVHRSQGSDPISRNRTAPLQEALAVNITILDVHGLPCFGTGKL